MLGGGCRVARGRVGYQDAALGSRLYVYVVHPDAGPPDGLEVLRPLYDLGGDLRALRIMRPSYSPIRSRSSPGPRSSSTSTSKSSLSSSTPGSASFSVMSTFKLPPRSSRRRAGRRRRPAKLYGIIERLQSQLGGRYRGDDVVGVEVAAVADAEDLSRHLALPARDLYPVLLKSILTNCLPSIPSGTQAAVTAEFRSSSGPNRLRPMPLMPARGTAEQDVALEDVLDALLEELLQRDVELDDEADSRRPGRLGRLLGVRLLRRRQSK